MLGCLQTVLNEAYKEEIITFNPNFAMPVIKGEQRQKEFLTLPELQALSNTDCDNYTVKRISLFSALTGLRHSDCVNLCWENVTSGEKPNIKFAQQKTKALVYMPISAEALELCGERQNESDKVFAGVDNSQFCNTIIEKWVKKAGIAKEITFHCFRHTFATLQLTSGTDIYTVSKMLGHADVKTTQIYAQNAPLEFQFDKIASDFQALFNHLQQQPQRLRFALSAQQQEKFNAYFDNAQQQFHSQFGDSFIGTVRRLGLSTFRIAMILTTLRTTDVPTVPNVLICSDTDFQIAMEITYTLIQHAALIFKQLPAETPEHNITIAPQQRLLQSLPQEFDRKKYLEAAKSLNIPDKTAEKQVERYLQSHLIERIAHGVYRKK